MLKSLKKTILIALIFLISASVFSVNANPKFNESMPEQLGVSDETDQSGVAKYEKVAENDMLTMYADLRYGWFAVRNNKTGYFWYSHPNDVLTDKTTVGVNKQNFQSDIVVFYLSRDEVGETSAYTEASVSSNAGAVRNGTVSVEKIENGIRVIYDFFTISARIPVEYTIIDGNLKAKIVGESILEQKDFRNAVKETATEEQLELMQDSFITAIWLLPTFGAGTGNDNGYVFVPDGSGAYINYTPSKETTEIFSAPVYGKDFGIDEYGVKAEEFASVATDIDICMPVFGGVKNGDGYFSIITNGAEIASIKVFKAGRSNNYTGVSSQVDYRHATFSTIGGRTVQSIAESFEVLPDYEVKYCFVDHKSASFMDFANIYKEYLKENCGFKKNEYLPSTALKVIGAIDVDGTFLGFPTKRIKSLTTINQLQKIIEDIKIGADINVAVNYIGWNNNGINNSKVVKKATPVNKLGSKNDLNNLISEVSKNGDRIYLDADLISFQKSGRGISNNSDSVQTSFGKASLKRKFLFSTFAYENKGSYTLTPLKLVSVFDRYYKSFEKLYDEAGVSFNSVAQNCYSDFNPKMPVSRKETVKYYNQIFSSLKGRNLSAEAANDYMWQYVDRIYSAPVSSSRQLIYDGEIPFYQLVTHGYIALTSQPINQATNCTAAFLRAVETGSELLFLCMAEDSSVVNGTDHDYLYSATYDLWKEDYKSVYSKYSQLLNKISNCEIVDYRQVKPSVYKTEYDNGTVVYVNYSKEDVTLENGTVVKAENFEYEEMAQ